MNRLMCVWRRWGRYTWRPRTGLPKHLDTLCPTPDGNWRHPRVPEDGIYSINPRAGGPIAQWRPSPRWSDHHPHGAEGNLSRGISHVSTDSLHPTFALLPATAQVLPTTRKYGTGPTTATFPSAISSNQWPLKRWEESAHRLGYFYEISPGRIESQTNNKNAFIYLRQRLAIAVQRGNGACVSESSTHHLFNN